MVEKQLLDTGKPFLKWAGGKGQLLHEIRKFYPQKQFKKFCEPFMGGGAVLLDIIKTMHFEEIMIADINSELVNAYEAVRDNPEEIIK